MMKNYDEHSSVLEEHACKKVTVGKWRRPSGQLKVMCSLSQFIVLLTLWEEERIQ